MISLRKSIEQIELYAQRFQKSVHCYASAIAGLEQRLITLNTEQDAARRTRLKGLHDRLLADPEGEALLEVADGLDTELESYKQAISQTLCGNQDEMRDVLDILGGLMASLAEQSGRGNGRLQHLSKQLEQVSDLSSMAEVRRRLLRHVADLKSYVSDAEKESRQVIVRLQDEMKCIKQTLVAVEEMAATDPLTGAANRRECERLLQKRINSGNPFSVLLFDLDGFKEVNDMYGHKWGDTVLVTFARRLSDQLRATDRLVRWGGDEFLVIFDCGLEEAQRRAVQMAQRAGGSYDVAFNGHALKVEVRGSCGVAEYQPGETVEQLFARVDARMYENKPQKTKPAPVDGAVRAPQ